LPALWANDPPTPPNGSAAPSEPSTTSSYTSPRRIRTFNPPGDGVGASRRHRSGPRFPSASGVAGTHRDSVPISRFGQRRSLTRRTTRPLGEGSGAFSRAERAVHEDPPVARGREVADELRAEVEVPAPLRLVARDRLERAPAHLALDGLCPATGTESRRGTGYQVRCPRCPEEALAPAPSRAGAEGSGDIKGGRRPLPPRVAGRVACADRSGERLGLWDVQGRSGGCRGSGRVARNAGRLRRLDA
jgi:hypothetical protein